MKFTKATPEEIATIQKAQNRGGRPINATTARTCYVEDAERKFTTVLMLADDSLYVGVSKRMTYGGAGQSDDHDPVIGKTIALSRATKGVPIEIPGVKESNC